MSRLSSLSDDELLHSLADVARDHRACTARLIAHLAEVDARRAHLGPGFDSLFRYCMERLHFSEDEACRRIEAARLAARFPRILELLESGSVTLTVLGLLKAHLTEENAAELLTGVANLSSRKAQEWLAARFPRPDVPEGFRKLGARPSESAAVVGSAPTASSSTTGRLPSTCKPDGNPTASDQGAIAARFTPPPLSPPPSRNPHRASRESMEPLSADRFVMRITVSRDLKDELDLARDLMRHRIPDGALEPILELAIRGLVEKLEREKLGKTPQPKRNPRRARHGRITTATKRAVVERDGLGCSWVSPDGHRCGSRDFLEFDHVEPRGIGGSGAPDNARLLCRAHNFRAAEAIYGKGVMRRASAGNSTARRTR